MHTAAILFSAHCSHLQLSAANLQCTLQPTAAIYNHLHCSYTNQCTLQLYYSVHTVAMYSYLQPTFSAHCSQLQPSTTIYTAAILSSAHCSYTIQCTLQLYYPVHTAAILSSAHCSYSIQCTLQLFYPVHLQLYYPVHTAAMPSSAHCSYTIQCTLQLNYLVPILYSTFSAPLNHHRVSLYHYWPTSRTVSRH